MEDPSGTGNLFGLLCSVHTHAKTASQLCARTPTPSFRISLHQRPCTEHFVPLRLGLLVPRGAIDLITRICACTSIKPHLKTKAIRSLRVASGGSRGELVALLLAEVRKVLLKRRRDERCERALDLVWFGAKGRSRSGWIGLCWVGLVWFAGRKRRSGLFVSGRVKKQFVSWSGL